MSRSSVKTGVAGLPFFPAFDYERFLEQGYAASWFALRRETVSVRDVEETNDPVSSLQFCSR